MFDHLFYCPHGGTAALVEAQGAILIFVLPKGLPETAVKSLQGDRELLGLYLGCRFKAGVPELVRNLLLQLPEPIARTSLAEELHKSLLCGDQKAGGDKGRCGHDGTSVAEAGSIAESARGESS